MLVNTMMPLKSCAWPGLGLTAAAAAPMSFVSTPPYNDSVELGPT